MPYIYLYKSKFVSNTFYTNGENLYSKNYTLSKLNILYNMISLLRFINCDKY